MKKRFLKNGLLALASVMLFVFVVSCDNESDKLTDGNARIQIKLTDAPALDIDEVNIDIIGVSVGVINGPDIDNAVWYELDVQNPGIYNLLDFRNGEAILLAGGDIPAGEISQIRLLLGNGNNVVVDDVVYNLVTPSAHTSGYKVKLNQTLEPGLAYSFVLDFDASRSIVKRGNGTYSLKPVVRAFAEAFGGSIKGFALPAPGDTIGVGYVQIISNNLDTLISLPEADGFFLFPGLELGLWDLTVVADTNTTFNDFVLNDVEVLNGKVTDVGGLELVSE